MDIEIYRDPASGQPVIETSNEQLAIGRWLNEEVMPEPNGLSLWLKRLTAAQPHQEQVFDGSEWRVTLRQGEVEICHHRLQQETEVDDDFLHLMSHDLSAACGIVDLQQAMQGIQDFLK